MPGEFAELLRHLGSSPYVEIERSTGSVSFRANARVIGALNFRSRVLSVHIPSNMVPPLLDSHPQLVGANDGVRLRVIDTNSRAEAERLLRWRIELERFAPQRRVASPLAVGWSGPVHHRSRPRKRKARHQERSRAGGAVSSSA
jgi:hypothetical protein